MLKRAGIAAALLVGGASPVWQPAAGQGPETVSVRVELVMPRYRSRFPDRRAVERKAAAIFAEYLTRNVGFLRFAVDDSLRANTLSFLLDRRDRSTTSSFAEVGFWVRLDRSGEAPKESYWLPFRTADQSLAAVGTEVGFLTEIGAKLAHQDADSLRGSTLHLVPIGEVALPYANPLGLALPFPLFDLCMKNQSVVQFLAEITGPVTMEVPYKAQIVGPFNPADRRTTEVAPFVGGAFGRLIDLTPQDSLQRLIDAKAVKVRKVFVLSYIHDPTACQNRTPIAVGEGTP